MTKKNEKGIVGHFLASFKRYCNFITYIIKGRYTRSFTSFVEHENPPKSSKRKVNIF